MVRNQLIRGWFCRLLFIGLACWPLIGSAHSSLTGSGKVVFNEDGTFQARIETDLNGLLKLDKSTALTKENLWNLPQRPQADQEEWLGQLGRLYESEVLFFFDGNQADVQADLPDFLTILSAANPGDQTFPIVVRFAGTVPENSKAVTIRNGTIFEMLMMRLSRAGVSEETEMLLWEGESGDPYPVDSISVPTARSVIAGRYLVLGYLHILPKGLDHILFVVGLFLLSTKIRPLLWQISAFTVAHTITLALSIYGIFSLPSVIVEPLIALSIAYVAIENIFTTDLKKWRIAVVFAFGLLHGLGFAGVLTELGLPHNRFITALLTFNVGVELGQLTVVLGAFLLFSRCYQKEWNRTRVLIPVSSLIAVIGLIWTVERIFSLDLIPI